jgi:Protein of unknown function (DUF3467)
MVDQPQPQVQLTVPPDKIAGHYANVVSVWNTPYDFAIDFCINQPYAAGPGAMAAQVSRECASRQHSSSTYCRP